MAIYSIIPSTTPAATVSSVPAGQVWSAPLTSVVAQACGAGTALVAAGQTCGDRGLNAGHAMRVTPAQPAVIAARVADAGTVHNFTRSSESTALAAKRNWPPRGIPR